MTLDKIFAEIQKLSDKEFEVISSSLEKEKELRVNKERQVAWDGVWKAICNYTNLYGDIVLVCERLGHRQLCLNADTGFFGSTIGKIEIL